MRKKLGYGLIVTAMMFVFAGCGNSVEVGPVPTITPRPAPTAAPVETPTQAPENGDSTEKEEEQTVYDTKLYKEYYEKGNELPQLKVAYQDIFSVGLDVLQIDVTEDKRKELVLSQFETIGCKEDLSPTVLMDYEATRASGDKTKIALDFSGADVILKFAQENNIKVHGPKLITSETPDWAFTKNFSESEVTIEKDEFGAKTVTIEYASADVLKKRMENYIKDVMEYCNTNYPGVVISWCVVDDPINSAAENTLKYNEDCHWYQAYEGEYIFEACRIAKKYATEDQKVMVSQRVLYEKMTLTPFVTLANLLKDENLINAIGIQATFNAKVPGIFQQNDMFEAVNGIGLEVYVTEFYVDTNDGNLDDATIEFDELMEKSRKKYKSYMTAFSNYVIKNGYNIVNVTFDGLTDDTSQLNVEKEYYDYASKQLVVGIKSYSYPYMFDADLKPKDAFFSALGDVTIKSY